jgi:transcriptional regulator with XRE-family HTH domain
MYYNMAIGERIKHLRTVAGLTQTGLAERVGLTYVQVGRYETGKSSPSSEVLQKLAAVLETTSDFLMNGDQGDAVSAQFSDKDLLKQFKAVEQLSSEDKNVVKTLIDALITKRQVQALAN